MTNEIKVRNYTMGVAQINDLRPNEWNCNHVSPENEARLRESLKRFGAFKPLIVRTLEDGSLQILGGYHRWVVARDCGYTQLPIFNVGRISEKQAKEISLADNGRYGEDDTLALAELLKEIGGSDEASLFLPFADDELTSIFSATSVALDEIDLTSDDDNTEPLPDLAATKVQTHQMMRFKVPIDDAESVSKLIEKTMKTQRFTDEDSLTNAGNALVHLLKNLRDAEV